MGLTPERYVEVDAELQEIYKYLLALALEIDEAAPLSGKQGRDYRTAVNTLGQVAILRRTLLAALEHQLMGEAPRCDIQPTVEELEDYITSLERQIIVEALQRSGAMANTKGPTKARLPVE
jgi:hypothetical protein